MQLSEKEYNEMLFQLYKELVKEVSRYDDSKTGMQKAIKNAKSALHTYMETMGIRHPKDVDTYSTE